MTTSARLRVIGQPEPHFDYGNDTSIYMADPDDDDNWLDEEDVLLDRTNHHLSNLAPGDEAAYESGAGGETSIIAQAESLVQRYVTFSNRWRPLSHALSPDERTLEPAMNACKSL